MALALNATALSCHKVIGPGVYMNVAHRGVGHDATDPSLIAMGHEPRHDLLFAVPLARKKVDGAPVCVLRQGCGTGDGALDTGALANIDRPELGLDMGQ